MEQSLPASPGGGAPASAREAVCRLPEVSCARAAALAADSFLYALSRHARRLLRKHLAHCPSCDKRFLDLVIFLEVDQQRNRRRRPLLARLAPRTANTRNVEKRQGESS